MTPAAQRKAERAAYMKRWKAQHRQEWNHYRRRYMSASRLKKRQQQAAALQQLPSLTLAQVVEWLRLKALVVHHTKTIL